MKKMELLAPAGSLATLRAVCAAGADAVYVGGGQFGARAYAKNFTEEELLCAIDEVHLQGKKLHLTVNTLLKTPELEEQLYAYLLPYYERGLDAVIVQDAGVFSFIKEQFPKMELHVSTQMSIAAADGARFWAQQGADRIVLARELSLKEIARVHREVDVPLECFVHGAICYCYSGQCLFSSMLGGRSGNRGRCAQPCRLPYDVWDEAHRLTNGAAYPLSPKDLCAIDLLGELAAAGVTSLKIEGRMKQTDYAAGVTAIYRKYLNRLEAGEPIKVTAQDRERLLGLGNRSGFTDGYLRGEKGNTMISLHSPKHTSDGAVGDTEPQPFRRSVSGHCSCTVGAPICLTVTDAQSGYAVTVSAGEIQKANKAPIQAAEIEKILRQTGETCFVFTDIQIDLTEDCFIPKQFLKTLRRSALEQLQAKLLAPTRRIAVQAVPTAEGQRVHFDENFDKKQLLAVCDTQQQFEICLEKDYIQTIGYAMFSIPRRELAERLSHALACCEQSGKKLLLLCPPVLRAEVSDFYESQWSCFENLQKSKCFAGFLVKTYDTLGFLQRMGVSESDIWLDSPLYTFSDRSRAFFRRQGYRSWTLPLELSAKELRRLPQDGSCLTIYGHTPFMVSSQCVNRTLSGCDKTDRILTLTDRYGKQLPVKNHCSICTNVIYNALPTVLYEPSVFAEVQKIAPSQLRMDFTVEDAAATRAVLAAYEQHVLQRTPKDVPFAGESTRGHLKRGVE